MHFTVICVKLCKICEHGGFSQRQSHISIINYTYWVMHMCVVMHVATNK